MNRNFLVTLMIVVFLILLAGCGGGDSSADSDPEFPTKNVTIYNASSAGSPTDLMSREVARHAADELGQSIVVENATGGGGGVMMNRVLNAPSDGYTIGAVTSAQMASLHSILEDDFSFEDFQFLFNVQKEPFAIAVSAESEFQTVEEMMTFAEENPGELRVGGQGTGSALHLIMLQLADAHDTEFNWVPYDGGAESVTNLLGGNVDVISTAPATVYQYVESGDMKILAITGTERLEAIEDVPTLYEAGYEDITMTQYRGFFVHPDVADSEKEILVEAISNAINKPEFKEFMENNNQPDGEMGPEEFIEHAEKEFEELGRLYSEYMQ
jgi:tripartite-type tricarboxylate transporter receptor subunit TctC